MKRRTQIIESSINSEQYVTDIIQPSFELNMEEEKKYSYYRVLLGILDL
jgi:hypothetical protein